MYRAPLLIAFLLLPLCLAAQAGAIVIRHDREAGAYLRSADHYPALFALYRTPQGHRDCIATLIHQRWAITAAHCTEAAQLTAAIAASGYSVEAAGRTARIDRVIRHESADIALLRFSRPIRNAAPLPLYRHEDEVGRTVVIPGWGGTGDGIAGLTPEDGLFRVAENRVDAATEEWLIWRFDDPRSRVGGAMALEGVAGPGDSGGPALVLTATGPAVAGISSAQRTYGRPEGVYGGDEYYVRVSAFLSWIDATIAQGG